MKYAFTSFALVAGASAASIPRSCTFGLSASGGESGTIGQLGDGQNRIGGGLSPASYSINNGQITDANGYGCILTPEVMQFQCDQGTTPIAGFSIGSNGQFLYNGSQTFYACPASDTEWNLYTTPVEGQTKCTEIELTANGCYSSSSSSVRSYTQSSESGSAGSSIVTSAQSSTTPSSANSSPATTPVSYGTTVVPQPTPSVPATSYSESSPAQPSQSGSGSSPSGSQPSACGGQPSPSGGQSSPSGGQSSPSGGQSSPSGGQPSSSASQPSSYASQPSSYASQTSSAASQTSSSASQTSSSASQTSSSASQSCPTDLSGEYQYPHLIIPVSAQSPDTAYGTSYNGTLSSDISSIFNFDIPETYTGTCSLVFLFPEQSQLETSSFTFSGDGVVDFKELDTIATSETTFLTVGSVKTDFGDMTVTPGSSTVVSTFSCPAGQTVSYELSAVSGTSLNYFEDWNPSPIGLFITTC